MANFLRQTDGQQCHEQKVATATNAANGGVAIVTKTGTPAKQVVGDVDAATLRDQGRWEEVLHALEKRQ